MADHEGAERLLRHRVAVTLDDPTRPVTVAASVGGDPPGTRVAWIDWAAGAIVARIACPPARPSRLRPVVATEVELAQGGVEDRVLAVRAAGGIDAVRPILAVPGIPDATAVGPEGVSLLRVGADVLVLGVEALVAGEPVGRLDATGITRLRLEAGRIVGRSGAGHGLAAGFGAGEWAEDLESASFEAGFAPVLPAWLPDDLERGRFHVEPDPSYPDAPPAVAVAWGVEPRRVLLRQTPGPLATPALGGPRAREVAIGSATGEVMSRGRFAALVWETAERAFGLQVVGFDDPADVAVRVARSL